MVLNLEVSSSENPRKQVFCHTPSLATPLDLSYTGTNDGIRWVRGNRAPECSDNKLPSYRVSVQVAIL